MLDELYVERTVEHPSWSQRRPRVDRGAALLPRSGVPSWIPSLVFAIRTAPFSCCNEQEVRRCESEWQGKGHRRSRCANPRTASEDTRVLRAGPRYRRRYTPRVPPRFRVGVQLPEVEREVRWSEYAAMARAAEDVRFDSIWVGDHLLYRGPPERGPREAWSLLAALAAVTSTVRLGPLVSCTAFREPSVLAKIAATVDEVSDGRLILGIGAGWNEEEFRAFGLPFDSRVTRFEEAFEIIRRLLAGERVTFQGRFHSVDDAVLLPKPHRQPPLMVGSNGRRMLAVTLPHVDAWNTWYQDYGNTPSGFETLNASITQAAARAGRRPQEIRRSACALVVVDRGARARASEVPPIEGSREAIARRLLELGEAGADEVILVLDPINEDSIRTLGESLELIERDGARGET